VFFFVFKKKKLVVSLTPPRFPTFPTISRIDHPPVSGAPEVPPPPPPIEPESGGLADESVVSTEPGDRDGSDAGDVDVDCMDDVQLDNVEAF
jgi:hypothetical protein